MKKIDYYASQTPWKMPKWLGATLGGIFSVIVIGSGLLIIQLTRPNTPPPIAAVAAAPIAQPAAAAAPVAEPSAPVAAVAAPATTADENPQAVDNQHHSAKHHAKKGAAKLAAASAKKPAVSGAQRGTILAKHDSKDKRHEKDALDKLLGL